MYNTAILDNQKPDTHTVYGAPEGQDARILAQKARTLMPEDRALTHIAVDDRRVSVLKELLGFFAPDVRVIDFPAWDCLPYDRVSPSSDIVAKRIAALSGLLEWERDKRRYPRIFLTTVNAASQRVMPREILHETSLSIEKGGALDLQQLQRFLSQNGYIRTETVREAGEYAIRGGIVDLFPSGFENPVRLDLFGDEVESIKAFDAVSQRSIPPPPTAGNDPAGSNPRFPPPAGGRSGGGGIKLQPATEFFLNEGSISRFRKSYLEFFGVVQDNDPLYESVSSGRRYNGMDHWLPLFYKNLETVFDYLPDAAVTFDHHGLDAYAERLAQIEDFYQARKNLQDNSKTLSGAAYNPLPVEALYLGTEEFHTHVAGAEILNPFSAPDSPASGEREADRESVAGEAKKGRDFADVRALPDGDVFAELKKHLNSFERRKLIASYSEGAAVRLKTLLETAQISNIKEIKNTEDLKKLQPHETGLVVLGLERGFVAPDLVMMTEQDILGDRLTRKSPGKKKKAENYLREVSSLNEGDLVVHVDHGIGKFVALETLEAAGALHDCLKIEYAGGDKLYVPVENLDALSRYGSDEGMVQLDRLGGAGWQARKAKVKKDLMEMADHLLSIAAARQLKKAPKIDVSKELYHEFAAHFPYQETEDQERAIEATLESISADYPMDRLICGDVGFGKTEVALRAAYAAVMSGLQVAVVVPTTLLARQHMQNFTARFTGTGIRVAQLSRMVKPKEAEQVKKGLTDGSVNIVIGTHALLAKGVRFSNLGLVIVDEEQKFGVKQKEKLKALQANVHVLTLTATPIPRTLQMSLTGVKELSLMTTPPVDRLAIRTFVMPFDPLVIREAILREHYRGGQTFYVCPRIADMEDLEKELKELVPEVKIISAHGQMPADDLDERMTAFYDGAYDVLLATNIIESGLDIPTANTMVVHRADMFGLAQLYQIRGRIGRSKERAYAYLTYPANMRLSDQAMKRLEVMETLDQLGAGFQLASHDMDIRGAGNLLGEQQSGHIKEIGVELYQQMLEESVAAAREGVDLGDLPERGDWSPTINVGTSVLIPESYVPDLGTRMSLYRRLAELGSEKGDEEKETKDEDGTSSFSIDSFAAELIDRFGPLPEEVENLLDIVAIKQLCKKAGVSGVEAGPKGAAIAFYKNTPPNVDGLMAWIQTKAGSVKIRPDQTLVAMRGWDKPKHRVEGVKTLMKELARLAG